MSARISLKLALAGVVCSVGLMAGNAAFAGTFNDGVFTITATQSQLTTSFAGASTFADSSTFAGYTGNVNAGVATITGGSLNDGTTPNSGINNSTINWIAGDPAETIAFNADQKYFGMLWGSVDNYNVVQLYEGGTLLDTITGTDLNTETGAPFFDAPGSFVDFVSDGSAFDKIVLSDSNGNCCFETDNYAAVSAARTSVPEPLTLSLFGVGVAGAAALRRRKKKIS
jgi:hypothetical protein